MAIEILLAATAVFSSFKLDEKGNAKTVMSASAEISNALARWRPAIGLSRAHGESPRSLHTSCNRGKRYGYCGLIDFVNAKVNGVPFRRLEPKPGWTREYAAEDGKKGFEYALNYDGATVRYRYWMEPDSPRLFCEVRCSNNSQTPIENIEVYLSCIPSKLVVNNGKSRFGGYRRAVKTAARYLEPRQRSSIPITPDDKYFVFLDEDFDGTAADKGMGPSACFLETPCEGVIELTDGWTTRLVFKPDPAKPFVFSLLEYPDERVPNEEFFNRLTKGK